MTNKTEIVRREPGAIEPVTSGEVSILSVLQQAVAGGMAAEGVEKLLAVYERTLAIKAKQDFDQAFTAFQAECPPVPRRTENQQFEVIRNGVKRPRMFASLDDIAATIRDPLAKHGLSYRWGDSEIKDGRVYLTCIVSHVGGHSEKSTLSVSMESRAGCSAQQKDGINDTYAQRYSLVRALGLTSCDEDDDGNEPKPKVSAEKITEEQAMTIDAMLAEVSADRAKFLAWVKADKISDIPASEFKRVIKALEERRRKNAEDAR